ncbi:hypothetical protein EDD22DRAFT_843979 [Suillus occidentalis]|nr:hypothetical protein EDD22DRAFT_843979 [Suillus occidentalis]
MPDLGTPYSKRGFPTNNHPVEGKSISAIVSEREQQLDTVLRDVSALETVMVGIKNLHQSLIEQKHKIIQSKLLHAGFMSVAGRLPTEILSQIFHYSLPEHEYLSPALKQAPMVLTSICRRWREVAVALGSQPSVYLRRHLIQPYINQIRSLLVFFSRGERRPEVVFGDLPALQELTISGLDPYSPAFVRSISFLPSTMRGLNVMNMRPHFDLELIDSCRLMWADLTNIEIAISEPNAVLLLLQLCLNLSSFTLHVDFHHAHNLEPLTHTGVQTLRIAGAYSATGILSDLFNALSLPNLRVLEALSDHHTLPLVAFLARSKCSLESFILGGRVRMTDAERAEYVALIPSIDIVEDDHGHRSYKDVVVTRFSE